MTTLNPHSDNPTFQAALSAFTFAAYHGSAFQSQTIEAATEYMSAWKPQDHKCLGDDVPQPITT